MKSVPQEPAAPILVVAGEASGDMYAAELVEALGTRLGASGPAFFGCGGPALRQAGMDILVDNRQLSVLGPFEAVSHLGRFSPPCDNWRLPPGRRSPAGPFWSTFRTSTSPWPDGSSDRV